MDIDLRELVREMTKNQVAREVYGTLLSRVDSRNVDRWLWESRWNKFRLWALNPWSSLLGHRHIWAFPTGIRTFR